MVVRGLILRYRLGALFFLLPALFFGQSNSLSFDITISPEIGRWVYDRGVDEQNVNLGFDRSVLSFLTSVGMGVEYNVRHFQVGIKTEFRSLFENELIRSQHTRLVRMEYDVATGSNVNMLSFGLTLGYRLVSYDRFSLKPSLVLGSFIIQHEHPDKQDFGFPFMWSGSMDMEWGRGNGKFLLAPHFTNNIIYPEKEKEGVSSIYSMGVRIGYKHYFMMRKSGL